MQIQLTREIYEFLDFKKEEFPIPYDEEDFPTGFQRVEILYRNGKPCKVSLYGAVDSIIDVKEPARIGKILEFVENKLEEQAAEPVGREQENLPKPPHIKLLTLEEAVKEETRTGNI